MTIHTDDTQCRTDAVLSALADLAAGAGANVMIGWAGGLIEEVLWGAGIPASAITSGEALQAEIRTIAHEAARRRCIR
jgi:hypothetical protein